MIPKDVRYIEIDDYTAHTIIRMDSVENFALILNKFKSDIIFVKKTCFLKYLGKNQMPNRDNDDYNPKLEFFYILDKYLHTTHKYVDDFDDINNHSRLCQEKKINENTIITNVLTGFDNNGKYVVAGGSYKITKEGDRYTIYEYTGSVDRKFIDCMTEFIILSEGVAYILPEYNTLSDSISPNSEAFGVKCIKDCPSIDLFLPDIYHANIAHKQYFGGEGAAHSPNQRADVFNPNNAACEAAKDNRANQLNPNHRASKR